MRHDHHNTEHPSLDPFGDTPQCPGDLAGYNSDVDDDGGGRNLQTPKLVARQLRLHGGSRRSCSQ